MAARGTVGTGNAAPRGRPAALAMVSERPANENQIPLEVERIRVLREFTRKPGWRMHYHHDGKP
jgi:hypothetical protein